MILKREVKSQGVLQDQHDGAEFVAKHFTVLVFVLFSYCSCLLLHMVIHTQKVELK